MTDRAWRCWAGHLCDTGVLPTNDTAGHKWCGWCRQCGRNVPVAEQFLLMPL